MSTLQTLIAHPLSMIAFLGQAVKYEVDVTVLEALTQIEVREQL